MSSRTSQGSNAVRLVRLAQVFGLTVIVGGSTAMSCSDSIGDACIPGVVEACPCPGGALGAQACKGDGTGFETCECPVDDGPSGGAPGAGGATGTGGDPGSGGTPSSGGAPGDGGSPGNGEGGGATGGSCEEQFPEGADQAAIVIIQRCGCTNPSPCYADCHADPACDTPSPYVDRPCGECLGEAADRYHQCVLDAVFSPACAGACADFVSCVLAG